MSRTLAARLHTADGKRPTWIRPVVSHICFAAIHVEKEELDA
jgi:hypothetical protein